MDPYQIIQKRVNRPDSLAKATGQAKFTTDLSFPGMLAGKVLRSPRHHARLTHLDATAALKVPGVKAVITAKDLPPVVYGFGDRRADMTVFDPGTIQDNSTYLEPDRSPSGIEYVVVNGRVTVKHGELTDAGLPGRVLRR